MKLSWLFVILLLVFVAVFSVQNAGVITVHFLTWEIQISAALVIQLAALLGALVGLACGAWSRRTPKPVEKPIEKPIEKPVEKSLLAPPTRSAPTSFGGDKPAAPSITPRIEKKPDAP